MLELGFEMNESVLNLSPASLEMLIRRSQKWGYGYRAWDHFTCKEKPPKPNCILGPLRPKKEDCLCLVAWRGIVSFIYIVDCKIKFPNAEEHEWS